LSENGKTLIYKWYLRFLKNPKIYRKNWRFFYEIMDGSFIHDFFFLSD
jgi:hypothetical protein